MVSFTVTQLSLQMNVDIGTFGFRGFWTKVVMKSVGKSMSLTLTLKKVKTNPKHDFSLDRNGGSCGPPFGISAGCTSPTGCKAYGRKE